MYRTILVPLDGSSFGEAALPLALNIARRAEGVLELLYVHPPWESAYPEVVPHYLGALTTVETEIKTRQKAYLDAMTERLLKLHPGKVACSIRDGVIAATIREHVLERKSDLVVMSTHGRGALGRAWLGSVADELVRSLSVPLLLVRPGTTVTELEREPLLQHLLLPLDGSPLAEQIIEPAAALGSLMNADYTLLQVVKQVRPSAGAGAVLLQGTEALLEAAEQVEAGLVDKAKKYLESVAQRMRQRSLSVHTRAVVGELPAMTILDAAAPSTIELVAMATHGRRGLSRLFLGSVADKVLRGSTLPMLVYRPQQP